MLAYEAAKRHVDFFSQQSEELGEHHEAMDCWDCQDYLQLGIDAFRWLKRAEEVIRDAVYQGALAGQERKFEHSLRTLYGAWLQPCDAAEQWAAQHIARGLSNLDEFRKCRQDAEERYNQKAWLRLVHDSAQHLHSEESW